MNTPLTYGEYQEILNLIIQYHAVFYQFWRMVKPRYSDELTDCFACVSFDKESNCVDFLINKKEWPNLIDKQKAFIISHECFHVLNSHGKRSRNKMQQSPSKSNCAMDVVVNESLVKYFGFKKDEVDPHGELYWFDNVFTPEEQVARDRSIEYYLNLLVKDGKSNHPKRKLINNHGGLNAIPDNLIKDIIDNLSDDDIDLLKDIAKRTEIDTKEDYASTQSQGNGAGSLIKKLEEKVIKPKVKWETLIKRFTRKMSQNEGVECSWATTHSRLFNLPKTMFLPDEIGRDVNKSNKEKIDTYFFLDTSGSCQGLAQRFWDAAKSIDREKFNVEFFCFDTKVYNINIEEAKLYGFGGTCFKCISNFVYNKRQTRPYVWVLTDGYGSYLDIPEKERSKWTWFLTENGSNRYIPQECRIVDLVNFE